MATDPRVVQLALDRGARRPFDAPDAFHDLAGQVPPPATDWAHRAARGVIADLQGRSGIKHQLDPLSTAEDTRVELVETVAAIIRAAHAVAKEGS
jgi:hypothetical protein